MPIMGMNTALLESRKMLMHYQTLIQKMAVSKRIKDRMQVMWNNIVFDEIITYFNVSKEASSLKSNTDEALKEMIDDMFHNFIVPMLNSHIPCDTLEVENPQKIYIMRYKSVLQWFHKTTKKTVVINLNHNTTKVIPRYV